MITVIEQSNVSSYIDMANLLYKTSDSGYIAVMRKGFTRTYTKYFNRAILDKNIQKDFDDAYDTNLYWSINTFYKPSRVLENLRYLNALYIDLDYYKINMRKESVLFFLNEDYFNKIIPTPSLIIDSGRGLYLIWLIDRVPSMALALWKAMEYYLYNQLKDFGADRAALDASRVLRIPGTINTENNKRVEIIEFNNYRYDLKDLKEAYLPEVTQTKKKLNKKNKKGKMAYLFNEYSLYKARLEDLEMLAKIREYELEGRRELFLFLYRYYSTLATGNEMEAEKMTQALNEKLVKPISKGEIKSTISNYIGKYYYKNQTLIDLFEITDDEMKFMKTIVSKEIKYAKNNDRRRKARRDEDGLTKRERNKRNNMISIVKGIIEDKKTSQISQENNLSLRLVQKYKKELKDNPELFEDIKNSLKYIEDNNLIKEQDDSNDVCIG